jgi:AraC family transcriptional regulator
MVRGTGIVHEQKWHGEAIIADTLKREPEVKLASTDGCWRFSRWRQFVGSYALPALPDPIFVVQLAGKTNVRTWDRDGWSETASYPGAATIVPATMPTRWLVDGELDVVTLSIDSADLQAASVLDQFSRMRFAFSDPLGAALARQILAELYRPASGARDIYVTALIDALKAHMLRGPATTAGSEFPTSAFSSYRIHHVMNAVAEHPEAEHGLEEMAAQAGITPSHFCRVFKRATGMSPHQYVLKARLERAQQMLGQSETSMSVIADLLGFTSQSHFNRAFRKFTGETPSSFRKRRLD